MTRNTQKARELVCVICGCTDSQACHGIDGACSWANGSPAPVCSTCVDQLLVELLTTREGATFADLRSRGWIEPNGRSVVGNRQFRLTAKGVAETRGSLG